MSGGPRDQDRQSSKKLEWDWDLEHQDRAKEAKADRAVHQAQPFLVDRRVLKTVVREKFHVDVARIVFVNSGTFHKAYLVTLTDGFELVARVARRFMPRIKTESEVATMEFVRKNTNVPVPIVYHHDSSPFNRLGGEYILMSKANGIPLSKVYHSMSHNNLVKLLDNAAALLIPLFGFRFPQLGSLYKGPGFDSAIPTPRAPSAYTPHELANYTPPTPSSLMTPRPPQAFHVGQIVSWPFFGSNRGELQHPEEINRGPWASSYDYLISCAEREINGVILENEGKTAPHRLHLDPDEIKTSRHHHLRAVPGDQSDDSDEYDLEESEEEWDGGAGDAMYSDYRRMQRSTFLIAHLREREGRVREEMKRFLRIMERLGVEKLESVPTAAETFALDCHDLNLENIFVDENDNTKITCIIDWESTTTRPLWACAHVPAFLNNSPFTTRLYRQAVVKLANKPPMTPPSRQRGFLFPAPHTSSADVASLAKEWLFYEESGARLRMAHRCIEWDGWEEGLLESILGPEDQEDDWFKWEDQSPDSPAAANTEVYGLDAMASMIALENGHSSDGRNGVTDGKPNGDDNKGDRKTESPGSPTSSSSKIGPVPDGKLKPHGIGRKKLATKVAEEEKAKEKHLGPGGDICGGIGGELGRRLEAWLHQNQHTPPVAWSGIGTPALSRTVSFGE